MTRWCRTCSWRRWPMRAPDWYLGHRRRCPSSRSVEQGRPVARHRYPPGLSLGIDRTAAHAVRDGLLLRALETLEDKPSFGGTGTALRPTRCAPPVQGPPHRRPPCGGRPITLLAGTGDAANPVQVPAHLPYELKSLIEGIFSPPPVSWSCRGVNTPPREMMLSRIQSLAWGRVREYGGAFADLLRHRNAVGAPSPSPMWARRDRHRRARLTLGTAAVFSPQTQGSFSAGLTRRSERLSSAPFTGHRICRRWKPDSMDARYGMPCAGGAGGHFFLTVSKSFFALLQCRARRRRGDRGPSPATHRRAYWGTGQVAGRRVVLRAVSAAIMVEFAALTLAVAGRAGTRSCCRPRWKPQQGRLGHGRGQSCSGISTRTHQRFSYEIGVILGAMEALTYQAEGSAARGR